MALDVYNTVSSLKSHAKNGRNAKHERCFLLLPAAGPLELVAMDISGPLPKPIKGNQHVVITTDRNSKLTRAVHIPRITTKTVAKIFFSA